MVSETAVNPPMQTINYSGFPTIDLRMEGENVRCSINLGYSVISA